jgi:hypothetical protein
VIGRYRCPALLLCSASLRLFVSQKGVDLGPLPSKFVSDLLRAERNRGRVERVAWGKYRLGFVPRTTRYRAKIVAADMTLDTKSRKEAEQNNLVQVRVPTYSWGNLMGHGSSRNRADQD